MASDFSGHYRSKKTKEQHILNSEGKEFPTRILYPDKY